jgi:hypothetical protein
MWYCLILNVGDDFTQGSVFENSLVLYLEFSFFDVCYTSTKSKNKTIVKILNS